MITTSGLGCIYQIICFGNGKIYIGSTNDFDRRKLEHLKELRGNRHCNPKLQRAFNKYGENSFEFSTIEFAEDGNLIIREQFWIDTHQCVKTGLNIAPFAHSGFRGRTWTASQREKISKNRKGKNCGPSNPMWGKNQPEERKEHQRKVMAGRYIGDKNPYFGKKHSEETRAKMREAHARSGRMKGAGNIMFGRTHTPEARAKISAARRASAFLALIFLCSTASAQLIGLPPKPTLSKAGENLILDFEIGDHTGVYYNRFLTHPEWPGAASGITWGAGYDGGTVGRDVIRSDWALHPDVDRLETASGIQGQRARSILPKYKDIETPYAYAIDVFNRVDVARFWAQTRKAFPGFDSLRPNAQAVLVSLVFNRGPSMAGEGRREMRAIRDLVPKRDYYGMAYQLRAMKRIWPLSSDVGAGLQRRREAEAVLMETP